MTTTTPDPLADAVVDDARSTLPIYVVADSPDGQVLSHSGEYPDDTTPVWLANTGSDAEARPMGDLYAEYGDDLVAYADPEEINVVAALYATGAVSREQVAAEQRIEANGTVAFPTSADLTAANVQDHARRSEQRILDAVAADLDRTPVTAALGNAAMDTIEAFIADAEDRLGITAALNGPGVIPRPVQRRAVGENPEAQAQVVAAFEANYRDDVTEFIEDVLGPRPEPDTPEHDAEAWDALAREARLWHARRLAHGQ